MFTGAVMVVLKTVDVDVPTMVVNADVVLTMVVTADVAVMTECVALVLVQIISVCCGC